MPWQILYVDVSYTCMYVYLLRHYALLYGVLEPPRSWQKVSSGCENLSRVVSTFREGEGEAKEED